MYKRQAVERAYWAASARALDGGGGADQAGDYLGDDDVSAAELVRKRRSEQFASFAESVDLGLARYQGPDGVKRLVAQLERRYGRGADGGAQTEAADPLAPAAAADDAQLRTLYCAKTSSLQLALLFAFVEPPYQPTRFITRALARVDGRSRVAGVRISDPGAGYDKRDPPRASIAAPPEAEDSADARADAWGDGRLARGPDALEDAPARQALARPVLRPTTRVLAFELTTGGFGYDKPPAIRVVSPRLPGAQGGRPATARAVLDGRGGVARVELVDPGFGYSVGAEAPLRPRAFVAPRGRS